MNRITMYDRKLDEKAIMAALSKVVKSGKLTLCNPVVREFEDSFAEWLGVKYAVACSSGTAALHLCLAACGIKEGDRVGVPELTYIATANAARYLGAEVNPCEVSATDWNLGGSWPDLDAMIVVHLLGACSDLGNMMLGPETPVLIEDACEAIGTRYPDGDRAGTRGHAAAFSFFWNKHITTGEGGMAVTNNWTIAQRMRYLMTHAGGADYRHEAVGYNYRMTAMQAAIGLTQMPHIEEIVASHQERWSWYAESLTSQPPAGHGCWMFGYPCKAPRRNIGRRLELAGIDWRPMFPMISDQRCYRDKGLVWDHYVARDLADSVILLPCHPLLTKQDVDRIVNVILEGEKHASDGDNERRTAGETTPETAGDAA